MKPKKTPQELAAAERQSELIGNALRGASADGYWLNAKGRLAPKIHNHKTEISPFNALILALNTDAAGYSTSLYTSFSDVRRAGQAVMKSERATPMNWYRWNTFANRYNSEETITREQYNALTPQEQSNYKAVRQREIRSMFNLEQTTIPHTDKDGYDKLTQEYGPSKERGNIAQQERQARADINHFVAQIKDNLVPIRRSTTGEAYYDVEKDAVYMPPQKDYETFYDYANDLYRNVVTATGHGERLAREGAMRKADAVTDGQKRYELLVRELAAGVKMMDLGAPARLSPEAQKFAEFYANNLRDNPNLVDALEKDVNNALDVIRKAERGEKIEFASKRDAEAIDRAKPRPQVSTEEALIMQDILRQGGMEINERNFPDGEVGKKEFMEKFNLTYYDNQTQLALWQARTNQTDPEMINTAYTAAAGEAARIHKVVSEMMPREWEQHGSHFIAEESRKIPNKQNREMIVVRDKTSGIADVIIPGSARTGGDVVMPTGERRNFWVSPDEVMLADERKAQGARVVSHNIPGFNKDKITDALKADGATYVRFFELDGVLKYNPDDAYFRDKELYAAKLNGKSLDVTTRFNVIDAVKRATEQSFDRIQMLKDDDGKWALLLKPEGQPSYAVYPEKDDLNRFFAVIRSSDEDATMKMRQQIGQKYHALAEANPAMKADLFYGTHPENIDTSRIQRVNIFRSKDDKIMLLPVIAGEGKIAPRELTSSQWQRLWVADNVGDYKKNLVAKVFADKLQVESNVEEAKKTEEKSVEEPEVKDDKLVSLIKQHNEMKDKHPDALLLFRVDNTYQLLKEDATRAAEIAGLKVEKQEVEGKEIDHVTFDYNLLDTFLPKFVRAGSRVAICEHIEDPRKQENRIERSSVEDEKRTGLRI